MRRTVRNVLRDRKEVERILVQRALDDKAAEVMEKELRAAQARRAFASGMRAASKRLWSEAYGLDFNRTQRSVIVPESTPNVEFTCSPPRATGGRDGEHPDQAQHGAEGASNNLSSERAVARPLGSRERNTR